MSKQATAINKLNGKVLHGTELPEPRFRITNYALLLKPRVMSLVVFTAAAGMLLAPGGIANIGPVTAAIAVLCIAIGAGASGAINMWYDRDIDLNMLRTQNRPLPAGRLQPLEALSFGVFLACGSVFAMAWWVNWVSAALLALTICFYVFIYLRLDENQMSFIFR